MWFKKIYFVSLSFFLLSSSLLAMKRNIEDNPDDTDYEGFRIEQDLKNMWSSIEEGDLFNFEELFIITPEVQTEIKEEYELERAIIKKEYDAKLKKIHHLPREVLKKIFEFYWENYEVKYLRMVCKDWDNLIMQSDTLAPTICCNVFNFNDLKEMPRKYPNSCS